MRQSIFLNNIHGVFKMTVLFKLGGRSSIKGKLIKILSVLQERQW